MKSTIDYNTGHVNRPPESQRQHLSWLMSPSGSPAKKKAEKSLRKEHRLEKERSKKRDRQIKRQKSLGLQAGEIFIPAGWEESYQDGEHIGNVYVSVEISVSKKDLKKTFDPNTGEWFYTHGLEYVLEKDDPLLISSYDSIDDDFQNEAGPLALKLHAHDDKKCINRLLRHLSVLSIIGGHCPDIAKTTEKLKELDLDSFIDNPDEDTVIALHSLIAPLLEAERRLSAKVSKIRARKSRQQIIPAVTTELSHARTPRQARRSSQATSHSGDSGDDDTGESDPPAPPLNLWCGLPYSYPKIIQLNTEQPYCGANARRSFVVDFCSPWRCA